MRSLRPKPPDNHSWPTRDDCVFDRRRRTRRIPSGGLASVSWNQALEGLVRKTRSFVLSRDLESRIHARFHGPLA
jgi:hypothetical protein